MSKALEIDSSRRSLLKYTVAGLLAGFGGRLLPHVSSAYAATEGGAKALVVYYSRSGNTRAVAEAIHAAVGGDIVELQSVTPYPEAYRATTDQAKQELASGYKPPLKNRIGHIEAYDVVFVGSPNWWGTVAGPVRTFLSEYDLAGKRIAPFITHEGSALGRSVADIKAFCPKAVVLDGLAVREAGPLPRKAMWPRGFARSAWENNLFVERNVMSKNILILSGSPRKGGNSDILCDRFMEGARESGHRAEKVFLRDKNIGYCIGCEACHQNNGVCVQKDDMAEILGKMIAADVIVMATPVYFYTMDAQMKTLIDRCVARYTEISNKAFYFIATAADGEKRSLERTIEGFRGFLYCLEGAQEKGIVYGSGAWKKGDIKESPALNEAYEMGRHA